MNLEKLLCFPVLSSLTVVGCFGWWKTQWQRIAPRGSEVVLQGWRCLQCWEHNGTLILENKDGGIVILCATVGGFGS